MKYSKFLIQNYKGIRHLELDLSKTPNAKVFTFVGLNESGKTTILDAIDFLETDQPSGKEHTLIPKNKKGIFKEEVSVEATLILDEQDISEIKTYLDKNKYTANTIPDYLVIKKAYTFQGSIFQGNSNTLTFNVYGKTKGSRARTDSLLDNSHSIYSELTKKLKNSFIPPIIYYPNFLFDFPSKIYLEEYTGESSRQETYRDVLQDILDTIDPDYRLKDHILNRIKSTGEEQKESLNSTLRQMETKITDTISNSWHKIFPGKKKLEIIARSGEEESSQDSAVKKYFLQIKVKHGSDEYEISERSLGFRWFFAYLIFTEFRKNRSTERGEILFLLDEPASNLHSTAQKKLLESFGSISEKSKLFYTTHSHHLINPEWLEAAYIVKNNAIDYENEAEAELNKTDIVALPYKKFIQSSPNQQSYFQPILDRLDYQPSKLEMVPDLIIVEGKNDFYSFKYLFEVILNKKEVLNLYPGGGAGKNDQVIRLYLSWGKNITVLEDSDVAGQKGKQKYCTDLGILSEDKVFILKDCDQSFDGKSTESLFSDSDKDKILFEYDQNKVFGKERFNKAIQALLFEKKKIELDKTTQDNFEKIHKFLASKVKNS